MSITVTNIAITSNVATITTSAAHGIPALFNGNPAIVAIEGLTNTVLNGVWAISSVPSPTTFTFVITNGNITSQSDSGTVILYSGQGLRVSQFKLATAIASNATLFVDDPAKAGSEGVTLAVLLAALAQIPTAYLAQQSFPEQTLTFASSTAWNANTQQNAKVTLTGDATLQLPSNLASGAGYILRVIQDATGSRTLAYATGYKWINGTAPILSTAPNAIDILTFYSDGTSMYGAISQGFA